jgi:signal peptidase II
VTEVSADATSTAPPTGTRPARLVVWGAVAGVFLADQISKSLALTAAHGTGTGRRAGWLSLRLVHNTGASFGIGAGHPLVITLVAGVSAAVVTVVLARTRRRSTAFAWAAVLGGTAGNLSDRFFRSPGPGHGAVVDWIHVVGYPPSFNLADLAIRIGAVAALVATANATRPTTEARFLPRWNRSTRDAGR